MPVKIKVRGQKTEDKPAATRKSTAKRPTASSQRTAKAAASRRGPAAREQTPKPDGRSKKNTDGTPVRRASKGVDARTEARLLKVVAKAGERRAKAEAEHKESINVLHDAARDAITAGVSMAKVADESGISRQWLYKMGDFAEREGVTAGNGNGNGKSAAAKPAAAVKRTPAKRAAKPASTRRTPARTRTASKPASTTRTRIRSRA